MIWNIPREMDLWNLFNHSIGVATAKKSLQFFCTMLTLKYIFRSTECHELFATRAEITEHHAFCEFRVLFFYFFFNEKSWSLKERFQPKPGKSLQRNAIIATAFDVWVSIPNLSPRHRMHQEWKWICAAMTWRHLSSIWLEVVNSVAVLCLYQISQPRYVWQKYQSLGLEYANFSCACRKDKCA